MSLFQTLVLIGVIPLNDLEKALLAFLREEIPLERFETELAKSKAVILLKEPPGQGGGIRPLVMDGADGRPALCVFTHQDRAVPMTKSQPEFSYSLDTEFSWILSVAPPGVGMVFNAGTRFSTEVLPEGVDEMRPSDG